MSEYSIKDFIFSPYFLWRCDHN